LIQSEIIYNSDLSGHIAFSHQPPPLPQTKMDSSVTTIDLMSGKIKIILSVSFVQEINIDSRRKLCVVVWIFFNIRHEAVICNFWQVTVDWLIQSIIW